MRNLLEVFSNPQHECLRVCEQRQGILDLFWRPIVIAMVLFSCIDLLKMLAQHIKVSLKSLNGHSAGRCLLQMREYF